jgi:hypothetical protein
VVRICWKICTKLYDTELLTSSPHILAPSHTCSSSQSICSCIKYYVRNLYPLPGYCNPQLISPTFTTLGLNTLSTPSTSLFRSHISVNRGTLQSTISVCILALGPPNRLPLHHHQSSLCFRHGRFILLLLCAEETGQPYVPYRRSYRL